MRRSGGSDLEGQEAKTSHCQWARATHGQEERTSEGQEVGHRFARRPRRLKFRRKVLQVRRLGFRRSGETRTTQGQEARSSEG